MKLEDGKPVPMSFSMSFRINPKHYFIILEGNKGGILKYKEGRINRYMGFDIKEIEWFFVKRHSCTKLLIRMESMEMLFLLKK